MVEVGELIGKVVGGVQSCGGNGASKGINSGQFPARLSERTVAQLTASACWHAAPSRLWSLTVNERQVTICNVNTNRSQGKHRQHPLSVSATQPLDIVGAQQSQVTSQHMRWATINLQCQYAILRRAVGGTMFCFIGCHRINSHLPK